MKAVRINTKFDEIRAINWRRTPLAALGRVVVYKPLTWGQPTTTLVIYEDGTVWCSAVADKPKDSRWFSGDDHVTVYPHDPEFHGLFWCLVKAGLIDKKTSQAVMRAASGMNSMKHPGHNISDATINQFASFIEKFKTVSGMKRARRSYQAMKAKDVDKAVADANADYAQRKAAAARKAEKSAKATAKKTATAAKK